MNVLWVGRVMLPAARTTEPALKPSQESARPDQTSLTVLTVPQVERLQVRQKVYLFLFVSLRISVTSVLMTPSAVICFGIVKLTQEH